MEKRLPIEYTGELWKQVRLCFQEDDGSLPSVDLESLRASEVADLYEIFMREGRITSHEPYFHCLQTNCDRSIESVPNPAILVTQSKACAFHVVFGGFESCNQTLPDLGVFVFEDMISFDYQMGKEWNAEKVLAFFAWLKRLVDLTKSGMVVPSDSEGPPYPDVFSDAWRKFLSWSE